MKNKESSRRVLMEMLQTAADLNAYGLVSKTDLAHLAALCTPPPDYPPERVVAIRTGIARMSQQVFAGTLNVSLSTVQKWESPAANKRPSGAAAKLLHLVETKGVAAILE